MMSPENPPSKPPPDDVPSPSSSRKPTAPLPPPEQPLRCPRCDSPSTKFCYYNNYSLTQPRHFCKTCRRYWTKGGALRNVPIGGGCRKSKKSRSAEARLSAEPKDSTGASGTSSGFNFLHCLTPAAALEFPLGGLPFSRLHSHTTSPLNHFLSISDLSPSVSTPAASTTSPLSALESLTLPTSLLGLNYSLSSAKKSVETPFCDSVQQLGSSTNVQSSIADSIESLSTINQQLHWKLQQQRLAVLYGGENLKESSNLLENHHHHQQQQNFILYQAAAADSSKFSSLNRKSCGNDNRSEWYFADNCYSGNINSSSNNNSNNSSSSNNNNHTNNNWSEIQTWDDLHHFSALP